MFRLLLSILYFIYEIKKYWENVNTYYTLIYLLIFCHLFAFFSCQLHGSRHTSQLNQEEQNWVRELHFRNRGVLRLQSRLLPLRVIGPDLPAGGLLGQAITRMSGYVCVGSLPTLYFSLFWLFIIDNLWNISVGEAEGKCHRLASMQWSAESGSKSSYDEAFAVCGKAFKVFQQHRHIEFQQRTAVNVTHLSYGLPKRGVLRSRASGVEARSAHSL